MISKLTHRQRQILNFSFPFILIALSYGIFIGPQLQKLNAIRTKLNIQQNMLSARQIKIKGLAAFEEKYQRLEEELKRARGKIFVEVKETEFLNELPELGKNTGNLLLSLKPFSPQPFLTTEMAKAAKREKKAYPVLAEYLMKFPVQVTIQGSYDSIVNLFTELEKHRRLANISQVRIQPVSSTKQGLEANFLLILYILPEEYERGK